MTRPGVGASTQASSRLVSKATSGRSSPVSSDFEEVGLEEVRSGGLGLGAGHSGVLIDSGDDSPTESPELPVTSILSAQRTSSAASACPPLAQEPQKMQRGEPNPTAGRAPDDAVFSTLREIEDAGHKVADFAKAAANDVTKKLFGNGSGGAAAGPSEDFSVSKLAAGVSSWWAALDPTQALQDATAAAGTAASPSKSEVQAFFGLPDSEELLEKFQCTLVQSYACTNNHFTTPRLLPYPGTLYITDRNSCFKSEIKETTLILPHTDVTRSDKVSAAHRDDSGGIKIFLGEEGQFVLFRAFKGPADSLDSALALIEHVTAAQSPKDGAQ